jgi:hypothetical protein
VKGVKTPISGSKRSGSVVTSRQIRDGSLRRACSVAARHGILETTNETGVGDDAEVEGHGLVDNVNETIVEEHFSPA